MMANDYTYAVARIRYNEKNSLSSTFIKSLIDAKSYEESVKLLQEKGWQGNDIQSLCEHQEKELAKLLSELVSKQELKILYAENDYHNLKAVIKSCVYPAPENIYLPEGTVTIESIEKAVRDANFGLLPEEMAKTAQKALKLIRETGDGQLCDGLIDKACILEMLKSEGLFNEYACFRALEANIKIAFRGSKLKKSADFYEFMLIPFNDFDVVSLKQAALKGPDAVTAYIEQIGYKEFAKALNTGSFRSTSDIYLIKKFEKYKNEYFGIEPIAAYYVLRQMEIKTVRIILTAQISKTEKIKERLGDLYA